MTTANTALLLEIRNVSRYFTQKSGLLGGTREVRAVDDVSLELRRGETLGLVGESGSGKSTVARMAVRLLKPSSGDVLLDGTSIFSSTQVLSALPRRLQMVFQDPYSSLNPRLRVGASIGEALVCAKVPAKERRERVAGLLRQVGLEEDYARRYPHEFSGGQRQRMAVARALAPEPGIIVCDEPVSSLDASVQAQVLNLLKDNQERLGLSYLFISHDLAVISHMSDRVAVMYSGRIMEAGSAGEIFSNPLHPYTRMLLEASGPDGGKMEGRTQTAAGPDFANAELSACVFMPRCPDRCAGCLRQYPELVEISPGRRVRCLRSFYAA